MLVLTRKPGEWLNIGYFYYIQVEGFVTEGKHFGKLKVRVILEEGESGDIVTSKEENRYLTNESLFLGYGVSIKLVSKSGNQFKIGVDAPESTLILRIDGDGMGEDVNYKQDTLESRYSEELSWFYDMKASSYS